MTRFPLRRMLGGALLFFRPAHDYWHPRLPAQAAAAADASQPYYLDFSAKADHPGPWDEQGVPLTCYGGRIGCQHYAIDISQYALGCYEVWRRTGQADRQAAFLRQADWLVESLRPAAGSADTGLWFADFDWHGVRAPWPSAMAQGQGLSVLARAYWLTGSARFRRAADRAWAGLGLPLQQGGVMRPDSAGRPFFEELPLPQASRILNGAIFSVWGALDYLRLTALDEAAALYHNSLTALTDSVPRYDLGFWTSYDDPDGKRPAVSSLFYHELHIQQLTALHYLTHQPLFAEYAGRWRRQCDRALNRLAALGLKILRRLT